MKALVLLFGILTFSVSVAGQTGSEIIAMERYFYDTLKAGQLEKLPPLFSEKFQGVFGGGYIDKKAEVEGFKSAVLLDYKFSEVRVVYAQKDVAIMLYRSYIKGSSKGREVTGESYRTSTWVRAGDTWQMILHTDVPVGDTLANRNASKANIVGLATAAYEVGDLAKAKDWYSRAFGTKPYFDESFYVGFNINGYELGLQPEEGNKTSVKGNGMVTYWAVRDINKTYRRFLDAGAKSEEKPADVGGGIVVASVRDPWGNLIGLIFNKDFKEME